MPGIYTTLAELWAFLFPSYFTLTDMRLIR